jgi:hypothetical protein
MADENAANQIAAYTYTRDDRDGVVLLETTLKDLETRMNTYKKTVQSEFEMNLA